MIEMANAFLSGLTQLFTATTFSLMMFGIAIGFIVGILPGLGGPTTLALMLPFIVKMKPVEAFAFLLGMQAVTATTGDITSILFGVPGEPTTAATIVDGHPMAKKGEAGRALGAALMSSLVGAAFGAFDLALAIPIVKPLILFFGSPHLRRLPQRGVPPQGLHRRGNRALHLLHRPRSGLRNPAIYLRQGVFMGRDRPCPGNHRSLRHPGDC
jgi:TctA family transporter